MRSDVLRDLWGELDKQIVPQPRGLIGDTDALAAELAGAYVTEDDDGC